MCLSPDRSYEPLLALRFPFVLNTSPAQARAFPIPGFVILCYFPRWNYPTRQAELLDGESNWTLFAAHTNKPAAQVESFASRFSRALALHLGKRGAFRITKRSGFLERPFFFTCCLQEYVRLEPRVFSVFISKKNIAN